jgi:chromosome segregation ATPase
VIGSSKKRFALWLVVAAATALLLVAGALSSPSEIETKQGEAAQVLDQIRQIDSDLDKAIDAYNGANERLSSLEEEIAVNRRHLAIARQAGKVAERNLERRRVSEQDAAIVEQVRAARAETARRQAKLAKALKAQQEAVAERAARKREIEARLAERQQLYASIEEEIEALQAAERRRQAQLARAAAARVASAAAAAPEGGSSEPIDAGGLGLAPPSQYSGAAGAALQFLGTQFVCGWCWE